VWRHRGIALTGADQAGTGTALATAPPRQQLHDATAALPRSSPAVAPDVLTAIAGAIRDHETAIRLRVFRRHQQSAHTAAPLCWCTPAGGGSSRRGTRTGTTSGRSGWNECDPAFRTAANSPLWNHRPEGSSPMWNGSWGWRSGVTGPRRGCTRQRWRSPQSCRAGSRSRPSTNTCLAHVGSEQPPDVGALANQLRRFADLEVRVEGPMSPSPSPVVGMSPRR
jgi:hypothetical protein